MVFCWCEWEVISVSACGPICCDSTPRFCTAALSGIHPRFSKIIIIISTASYPALMCSFQWPLRQGVPGTIRRWNWYRRLEDGRPTLQAMPGSPPSCSSSCPWHYRGGMRSHFKTHSQPANSLQSIVSFLNVLVPTGFVLVGQKIIIINIKKLTV